MNLQKGGRLHKAVYSSFSKNLIKVLGLVVVFFIFVIPVIRLVIMSFTGEDGLTSDFYKDVLSSDTTWTVLTNTAIIVILSTLISSVLGIVFAWLIAYTDIRAKSIIQLFIFLPFIIPSYIISLA